MRRLVSTIAVLWLLKLGSAPPFAAERSPDIDPWIRQAGQTEDDAQRLELLKQLRTLPGLDPRTQTDLDRMAAFVERWLDSRNLTFFGGEIGRNKDFDFHIAADSPVYPLTRLYRARMLVWTTLENGNIIRYPDVRRQFLDKAVEQLQAAKASFPENRIVRMYLGEPLPNPKTYLAPENAPAWARYQRENLERLSDIIHWWIDYRMQPDGQFGGGWGDDCEMWRWWAPVLIGFDDPKITTAQSRFSRALLGQSHMKAGYTSQMSDVEHTAEDSSDAITPMMVLESQNPEWQNRALRLVELMENLWTGKNERGFLQFKSTYFTADRVDPRPERACDTAYHPRALQPALLLWQRTNDKRLAKLFTTWMDTWVDAARRSERGKPAGIVPTAIHWPDGRIGGTGQHWWDPRNHGEPTLYEWPSALPLLNDTLLLTYHMTGDEKYLEPLRSMASIRLKYLQNPPRSTPPPGSEAWCASHLDLLASTLAKYKAVRGSSEFDELLRRDSEGLAFPLTTPQRDAATKRLGESCEALRINFPGYTREVRWTDRVLRFPALFGEGMMFPDAVPGIRTPNPGLLYSLVTGDPGAGGYFSLQAVRWHTPPHDLAAIVTDSGGDRFAAELFHFGDESRKIVAEFYLLSAGDYVATMTMEDHRSESKTNVDRRALQVAGPGVRWAFELPPQRLVRVKVEKKT